MAKTQQKATTLSSSSLVCPRYNIIATAATAATLLIVALTADGLGLRFGRGGHVFWSSSDARDVADDGATAVQLSNDPESYFGGAENDNLAYVNWAKNIISSRYNASVYLPSAMDPSLGAAIHWRIVNDEWLHIAVAARATGWVGFGLSGAGGMLGSDMALFVASRPSEIVDAHVMESFVPQPDDCQQDWLIRTVVEEENANGEEQRQVGTMMDELEESGFLTFEAHRKLDTGDPQDWPITVNDADPSTPPHRIIAAWGDDDNDVRYHGRTNVARGAIRFYSTKEEDPQSAFERAMKTNKAEGSFLLQAPQYSIPPQETTYIEFCFARADLLQQGVPDTTSDLLNVIGFQPFVTPGSEPYVHHFVVYGSYDSSIADCNELDYVHVAYAWAPGDGGFALPDFLGAPLFGPSGFQSFYLQIHYNNPRLDRGIIDSSGVQMFYTSQPREFEMGLLQLGDPDVELDGTKVGADLTAHTFECPGSCSALFLGDDGEPVTVFRTHLHMHQHGTRVSNEQIRNGQVVRTASVEVWEFDQNGNAPVLQEPYQIFPGDAFRTSCYYRGSDDTEFGFSSSEEMCISFLYYYPRKSIHLDNDDAAESSPHPWICGYGYDDHLPVCAEKYTHSSLAQDSFMNREFGQPMCTIQDSP